MTNSIILSSFKANITYKLDPNDRQSTQLSLNGGLSKKKATYKPLFGCPTCNNIFIPSHLEEGLENHIKYFA